MSFSIVLCTCNFILSYLFRSADLGNPNICMELLLSMRQNLLKEVKANTIAAQVNKNHELIFINDTLFSGQAKVSV